MKEKLNAISLGVLILFLSFIFTESEAYSQCSTLMPAAPSSLTLAVTSTVTSTPVSPSNGTDSSLVGYWKFDEGTGSTACDSSGKGNNGTLINGPLRAIGKVGGGLYFDGIDDNVTVADSNSLDVSSSFTLSAWVNPASTSTDFRSILVKNYKYYLYASVAGYCGTGNPLAGFDEQTTSAVCQPAPLPANTWTHLAATYSGSILTLYRNGVAVATSNITKTLSPSTGTLQIGASQFGENFKGLIDEVRLHNRGLTTTEVQALFQQDSAVRESGLVAHWKFDEGNGTTASDSSGSGNAGTLTNGPLWMDGRIGKGLYFDGVDDNVRVADSNSLDVSSSFTLSAWVNPASTSTDFRSILVKNYKYYLYASVAGYCGSGSPLAGFDEQTTNAVCQPTPLPANSWTHLAATYTGSVLTLYRNGVAVATSNITNTLSPSTGTLQIGASQFGENFKGLIDEVRVHNRALTNSEIQAIFQQESGGAFSFSIANSGDKSVIAGSSVTNSVAAALDSGSGQVVSFNVAGLPPGAAGTFSSASCIPVCSTVLTISTTESTPAGSFPITVTSAGGGVIRSTGFTLSVTLAFVSAVTPAPVTTIAPAISTNAYFVARDGSDSNPGTLSQPFRTITKGLSILRPGYTLYIRAGTYSEHINLRSDGTPIPGGTSYANGPKIIGYPGDARPVVRGDGYDSILNMNGQDSPFVTVKDMVFDSENSAARSSGGVVGMNGNGRLDNVEIMRVQQGVAAGGSTNTIGLGVIGNGAEVLNSQIHDNLGCAQLGQPPGGGCGGYGIYAQGTNMLVDNSDFYGNGAYAIHIYSGSTSVSGNVVRNSRIWGNNILRQPYQVIISSGSNNQFYNNIVNSPATPAGGIQVDYNCKDCTVVNNLIYNHSNVGIFISSSAINTIAKDNKFYQVSTNIVDSGVGTVNLNNSTLTSLLAP